MLARCATRCLVVVMSPSPPCSTARSSTQPTARSPEQHTVRSPQQASSQLHPSPLSRGVTQWYTVLRFRAAQRYWQPNLITDRRVCHERRNELLQRQEFQDLVLVRVVWVCPKVDKVQRLRIVLFDQTLEVMTSLLRARQHTN